MSAPATIPEFLDLLRQSGAAEQRRLDACLARLTASGDPPTDPGRLAVELVREGLLTGFQARQLLRGRGRDLKLGKYLILDQLGSGGMGVVYLAQHRLLRRRVAIKVLPFALARDPWFLEQFYREARAVAALDHPNIVRAHDVDQQGNVHFLVMEYVNGSNLQAVVEKRGPLEVLRAAHYVRQGAAGLQHAFAAGLVHRDVKPGNLLLDRRGTVKVSDLGLACFLRDRPGGCGEEVRRTVGTDDFLAPEQIVNSDEVDTRADVYGLGATFYFLLTARTPFADVELPAQKLVAHLTRGPRPVNQVRPDVPRELAAVIGRMMAKNPWDRYQTPAAVAEALAPWIREPVPPPPPEEMPALGAASGGSRNSTSTRPGSSSAKRTWVISGGQGSARPTPPPRTEPPRTGKVSP